jgi:hypothetical protein
VSEVIEMPREISPAEKSKTKQTYKRRPAVPSQDLEALFDIDDTCQHVRLCGKTINRRIKLRTFPEPDRKIAGRRYWFRKTIVAWTNGDWRPAPQSIAAEA